MSIVTGKRPGESSAAFVARELAQIPRLVREARVRKVRNEVAAARRQRRADTSGASAGLVKRPYLAAYPDGRLVELFLPNVARPEPPKRGSVDGMSEKSRRRLLALLHSIRRTAELPVLVSLTFPEELIVSGREAKACFHAFKKRMRREHPVWCALWRLEAHPEMSARLSRMHPHLHLLTWGAWYDLQAISLAWHQCVWEVLSVDPHLRDAEGVLVSEKHIAAGTNCERVRAWAGVSYCAKRYIAKEAEYPTGKCGRVWGWAWLRDLPVSREEKLELTTRETVAVVARVRDWMNSRGIESEYLVRTFYCDNPAALARWFLTGEGECPDPPPKHKGKPKK